MRLWKTRKKERKERRKEEEREKNLPLRNQQEAQTSPSEEWVNPWYAETEEWFGFGDLDEDFLRPAFRDRKTADLYGRKYVYWSRKKFDIVGKEILLVTKSGKMGSATVKERYDAVLTPEDLWLECPTPPKRCGYTYVLADLYKVIEMPYDRLSDNIFLFHKDDVMMIPLSDIY